MVNNDIGWWNQPPFPGFDLRAVDNMSDNQVLPYSTPFRLALPKILQELKDPSLEQDPLSKPPTVDYSDNPEQLQVIRHHYKSELPQRLQDKKTTKIRDVLEDYASDSVIYEVLDEVPKTYKGKRGVRLMCQDVLGKVQNIHLEHVAINHGHAQVVWRGETTDPSHKIIVGTDSFTFGEDNRIVSQTIVALTQDKK